MDGSLTPLPHFSMVNQKKVKKPKTLPKDLFWWRYSRLSNTEGLLLTDPICMGQVLRQLLVYC